MLYPDVVTALADSDRLVDEKRFDGVIMFTFANGNGGDSVVLRGTKYYSPPATPDDATMLAGLNFVPGVMQIDDLTYVENFSITTGPFPPLPHPAICVVLPASAATQWIQGVLPRLTRCRSWHLQRSADLPVARIALRSAADAHAHGREARRLRSAAVRAGRPGRRSVYAMKTLPI